jgi:protein-S-isoprenylcysteine O-methyltransferase Ste14
MSNFFSYFQFAALVLFLLLFSGKALYLRFSKGINTATVVAGKRGIQRAMEFSFIIGLIVWINEVLLYSIHIGFRIFPELLDMQFVNSTQAKLIGVMLIAFGFVIYILALIALGDSWRMGIDNKAPGKLVTAGIFSVSRNPIYVFIDLYFTGTFLINGTLIFLIFAILTIAALHFQILQEERFLAKTYGQAYGDYCARTGRYITWKGNL